MQRKTKKIFDFVAIILNVILLTFMILCLIFNEEKYYSWYWIIVTGMFLFEAIYIHKWDKIGGIDVDKNKSKSIRRSFDGITTGTLVISGIIYLLVIGLEFLDKSIKTNSFVIIIMGVMLTFTLLCNLLAIYTANRDTKRLAEKMFKYKN